jgi:hypothetical protein
VLFDTVADIMLYPRLELAAETPNVAVKEYSLHLRRPCRGRAGPGL